MIYYEANCQNFIESTINIDMTEIYSPFLAKIKDSGKILDLGCGSGRDLKFFKSQGHCVIGLESATNLADFAQTYSECSVFKVAIEDFETEQKFDGIWACASLLHLKTETLKNVFLKIESLMHENSVFYCSFKYGNYEGERNGRFFNDQTLKSLENLLPSSLRISNSWISEDIRPNRDENWLNTIMMKS